MGYAHKYGGIKHLIYLVITILVAVGDILNNQQQLSPLSFF
jgi:hypothetical protein